MCFAIALALVSCGKQDSIYPEVAHDDRDILTLAYRSFAKTNSESKYYLAEEFSNDRGSFKEEINRLIASFSWIDKPGHGASSEELAKARNKRETFVRVQMLTSKEADATFPTVPISKMSWDKDIVFDPVDYKKFFLDGKIVKEHEQELRQLMRAKSCTLSPDPPCYSADRRFAILHTRHRNFMMRHPNGEDLLLERKDRKWQILVSEFWMYL